MKILHGTSTVSIQSTKYLVDELNKLNCDAKILVHRSHPFILGLEDYNIGIDTRKIYLYPLYLIKVLYFFVFSVLKFDVFHFHFGRSFFPFNLDLYILKLLRKKVFMEYHGSEIRRKSVYLTKRNTLLGFSGVEDKVSYKIQKRISRNCDGIIVHDIELKEQLYNFLIPTFLVPLRINVDKFIPSYPVQEEIIKIIHAPTKRNAKGTNFISEAISKLKVKHNINYKLIENLPYEELINLISESDIVIDQILIGSYGMFSIESMAMGKPTICYIREDLIDTFPNELPIYNANILNIENRIEELITDIDLRIKIGIKGRKYVEKHHNSKTIARNLLEIYK